jgi:hypothetical protein
MALPCRGRGPWTSPSTAPPSDDPYAHFEYVVLIGFEKTPTPRGLYPAVEVLGGVVLNERQPSRQSARSGDEWRCAF